MSDATVFTSGTLVFTAATQEIPLYCLALVATEGGGQFVPLMGT